MLDSTCNIALQYSFDKLRLTMFRFQMMNVSLLNVTDTRPPGLPPYDSDSLNSLLY
jgi:hypothetical protein